LRPTWPDLLARPPGWASLADRKNSSAEDSAHHSAITVANTARSIAFYQGLGFSLLSSQVNRGSEQEQLDDLEGAVVEVTGLGCQTGAAPHLELLRYLHPSVIHEFAAVDDPRSTRLILESNEKTCLRDPNGHLLASPGTARTIAPDH
jgi:catechol 2,3-dioxygenase-like lactoylglutathione lyase family enzyme